MKRGILFVAVGMTVAGVASANVFTASSNVAPQPQSQEAPSPAQRASLFDPPAKPIARAADPAPVKKASLETRQAPVPLQVKPRPPVNLPAVNPKAGETKAGEAKAGEAKPAEAGPSQEAAVTNAASSDGSGEKAAKAAIEADGYKGVRVLRQGVNGIWHAKALRGKTEVQLVVDASGTVSTE